MTGQDFKVFAEDVEQLCKRLTDRMQATDDRNAILKLQERAANYATCPTDEIELDTALEGIAELLHV